MFSEGSCDGPVIVKSVPSRMKASNVAAARCAGNRAVSDGCIEPARKANVAGFAFALSRLNCADCAGFSASDVPCMSNVSDLSLSETIQPSSY
jgi:hypothetical protein